MYASTRGEVNSISVFKVDEYGEFYRIQVMEDVPNWPRDFKIDPSGKSLLPSGEIFRKHENILRPAFGPLQLNAGIRVNGHENR